MNLMVNAFQAMPQGGRLRIAAAPVNGAGGAGALAGDGGGEAGTGDGPPAAPAAGLVEVAFHDTGPGIPAADLPHVFEPYFTTKETGIGLGLALTKKIVEEHGGTIAVESQPGEGTRVTIRLPVAGAGAPEPLPVAAGGAP
jgi:signal transduction histidine kinase